MFLLHLLWLLANSSWYANRLSSRQPGVAALDSEGEVALPRDRAFDKLGGYSSGPDGSVKAFARRDADLMDDRSKAADDIIHVRLHLPRIRFQDAVIDTAQAVAQELVVELVDGLRLTPNVQRTLINEHVLARLSPQ